VILTNAAKLSDKAIIRTRWVNAEAFRALSPEAFKTIEAWLKTKPLPIVKAKPDTSYQVQALADIRAALAKGDRATAVMACGTGKTLVALWAAEQEAPKTVLVLVPSLTLLQQTLLEWSQQTSWGRAFSYLCVCSDPTVKLKDDGLNTDTSEIGFRVDTDPAIVRHFLKRQTSDIKVIFSTYQSSPVVGEGARVDAEITCGTLIVHGEINGNTKAKAWRDIWGSGQGIGQIADAPPVAELVERMKAEVADAGSDFMKRISA
jgi:hypothetical protein